ncbi:hypothetical protein [Dechloromonas sp. H13]|uniref:hypothetical protein n=1 Tax=Dechloromonas sp. H13 TaxID=2570193 RepID=UPI0012921C27|nr:hypothetical protein [Dechloromonas sp. H13]
MTFILGILVLLVVGFVVAAVVISAKLLALALAIALLALAALSACVSYLLGWNDPQIVFLLVLMPGAVIAFGVYGYREQQREEKEEAERKASKEAERRRRQSELAKPKSTAEVWLRGLFD